MLNQYEHQNKVTYTQYARLAMDVIEGLEKLQMQMKQTSTALSKASESLDPFQSNIMQALAKSTPFPLSKIKKPLDGFFSTYELLSPHISDETDRELRSALCQTKAMFLVKVVSDNIALAKPMLMVLEQEIKAYSDEPELIEALLNRSNFEDHAKAHASCAQAFGAVEEIINDPDILANPIYAHTLKTQLSELRAEIVEQIETPLTQWMQQFLGENLIEDNMLTPSLDEFKSQVKRMK